MAVWAALNGRFTALASVGILFANDFPLTTQCLTRAETSQPLRASEVMKGAHLIARHGTTSIHSNPDESCHKR
jgi:hypothetical protein